MSENNPKYANIIFNLYVPNLLKNSTAAQLPLAGHMRPAARVFETPQRVKVGHNFWLCLLIKLGTILLVKLIALMHLHFASMNC
jgi:hypothetical protein